MDCAIKGCARRAAKRGWCDTHYQRWRNTGDPTTPAKYPRAAVGGRCQVCDDPRLMPKSRRYCSPNCAVLASRARRGDARAIQRTATCVLCDDTIDLMAPGVSHSGRPSTRKRRADTAVCATCCRRRKYRHKFPVRVLAKRDGAFCRLCLDPVDLTLRFPHPACPSVDHIVSRAQGGTDDQGNLQLAHLRCNHLKSRRSGWVVPRVGQLALAWSAA